MSTSAPIRPGVSMPITSRMPDAPRARPPRFSGASEDILSLSGRKAILPNIESGNPFRVLPPYTGGPPPVVTRNGDQLLFGLPGYYTFAIDLARQTVMPLLHGSIFMREPELFDALPGFLDAHFTEIAPRQEIPVHIMAGSAGENAYGLAMKLKEGLPAGRARNFPILSTDLAPTVVMDAQRGIYMLDAEQVLRFELLNGPVRDYFDILQRAPKGAMLVQVKPEYRRNVRFKTADLMQELQAKKTELGVVMLKNAWYHFTPMEQSRIANGLANSLKPGSLVVLGGAEVDQEEARHYTGDTENSSHKAEFYLLATGKFQPVLKPGLTGYVFLRTDD